MLLDQITPFVRFAAEQNITNCWINDGNEIVGYDHRIYFVLSGDGVIRIGGKDYPLQPNSFVMWRAGVPYAYKANTQTPLVCITCNFDFTATANTKRTPIPPCRVKAFNRSKITEESVNFSDLRAFNGTVFIPAAPNVRSVMSNLAESYAKKEPFFTLKCNTLLQDVLYQAANLTNSGLKKNNSLVLAILDYVRLNFRSNPTNEEIGAKFGYHPNYINALVVKHTKTSLHRFVIDCKLSHAMQLLLTTDMSISEIANEINIPDPQYFSRLFKKYYKKAPSAFRVNK